LQKAFLIFSGYNFRAIVTFCRELKALNLPFVIIACLENDPVFYTKYKKYVGAIRVKQELEPEDVKRCIQSVQRKNKNLSFIICPSSEFLNIFLLDNQSFFESLGCSIPLVSSTIYELVSNKDSFSKLCKDNGISVPKRYSIDKISYPCVAKPKKNIGSNNKTLYPYILQDMDECKKIKSKQNTEEYYFEEYIDGASYYILLYLSKSGKVIKFSQKNLIQQAGGKSIVLARSSKIHNQEIADQFINILHKVNFTGIIMIEVKHRNGEYFLIEANPRLWGPSQLFVDAGIPIFKTFINDFLDPAKYNNKVIINEDAVYLWFNGLLSTLLSSQKLAWHFLKPTFPLLYILQFLNKDVYLRPDTINYFFKELSRTIFKK
jgi:hypothetical protein